MTITLYDLTVPVFLRGFDRLETLLDKGRDFAAATGIAEDEIVTARLAPDMLTLAGQVQRASDTAKLAAVRIGGIANEPFPDEEKTLAELGQRIGRTRAFLRAMPPSAFDGREAAALSVTIGRGRDPVTITGADYALRFALPNFFFHVTTAYDILRHLGVPLGKLDFIGPLD